MGYIRKNPGIHKSELCRITGLAWGTVGHHLRVLKKEDSIQVFHVGRVVHVTPSNVAELMQTHPALLAPDARKILHSLAQSKFDLGPTSIARDLDMTTKQVRKHLSSLQKSGLVEEDGAYHPRFRPTRSGQQQFENEGIPSPGELRRSPGDEHPLSAPPSGISESLQT